MITLFSLLFQELFLAQQRGVFPSSKNKGGVAKRRHYASYIKYRMDKTLFKEYKATVFIYQFRIASVRTFPLRNIERFPLFFRVFLFGTTPSEPLNSFPIPWRKLEPSPIYLTMKLSGYQ